MESIRKFLVYWMPPIVWMILIFYLSSRPRISITHEFVFDFVIFKTLHIIEYGILYFLLFRAYFREMRRVDGTYLYPFIIASLYALSDEIHQTLVPTREGRMRDFVIDLVGIGLAYWYIKHHLTFIKKRFLGV